MPRQADVRLSTPAARATDLGRGPTLRTGSGQAPCVPHNREHEERHAAGIEINAEGWKNTCIYMYKVPLRDMLKWNPGGDASWKRTRRWHSSSHSLFVLRETWSQKEQDRSSYLLLFSMFALNICYIFEAFVSGALEKASIWFVSLTRKDCREYKPASKIDCRGVVHIVRVLWGFR